MDGVEKIPNTYLLLKLFLDSESYLNDEDSKILFKTISWRFIASSTGVLFIYLISGKFMLAMGVGVYEVFVRTALYFLHEKAWNNHNNRSKSEQRQSKHKS